MYTIEKTKEALIKKFQENNWEELTLTLKTGDTVWINPCPAVYGKEVKSPADIEYYLMSSDTVYLCGADNLDKVADTLNNFSDLKKQDLSEKDYLEKYFQDNIVGHTQAEWDLGSKIDRAWFKDPEYDWHTSLHDVAIKYAGQFGVDIDTAEKALRLVECASTYSDMYKDTWGHRPRYTLEEVCNG